MSKKSKPTKGCVIFEAGSTVDNKTGGWRALKPDINVEECIKCRKCWMFCPDNAISEDIQINYDYCKGCGICAKVCPKGCIKMNVEEK